MSGEREWRSAMLGRGDVLRSFLSVRDLAVVVKQLFLLSSTPV